MKYIFAAMIAVMFSCTNPEGARRALEDQGFTSIELTGHQFYTCGSDDTCTGFTAVNPAGRPVSGAVGCGLVDGCSKGCTVRFN